MKILGAILYTILIFAELLAVPVFLKRYINHFHLDSVSVIGFEMVGLIFLLFQLFLCGLLWYSALVNKSIKQILDSDR